MPAIIDASNNIDITLLASVLSSDRNSLTDVHNLFCAGVEELKLLLQDGVILFVPTSFGKDSTVTLLMALEAYRQAIVAGEIESDRPLISSTINTGMESIPMTLYQSFARKRLLSYAQSHSINIQHEIITPELNDQYFVRFAGAQKLIANASRSGDCSVILKIKPSEKYVKSVLESYPDRQVISVVGSRTEESARRSNNMAKQGIAKKSIEDLRAQLSAVSLGKVNLLNFAPIRDWSTDQVFDLLRIAGDKPLTKTCLHIPAFLPDFGLLAEIYGNGSNETCSIAVGQTSGGAGCNGKARFGCTQCTMVGGIDQSSTALAGLERWRVLGVENATRLRDYLFRLSTDMTARAFHARAYDPAAFSRVALQPNVLKPKYLEKIIRLAGQLTLDSIRVANEFKALIKEGRENEFPGMACIAGDVTLNPKVKRAFLEMYKEGVQDPKNLNYLFDQNHAILLSYRWAIDGIGSAPFRPLAIWHQLSEGQGWIPYPKLNSELEALTGDKIKIVTGDLPEAVLFRVFKHEDPEQFAKEPLDALTLWHRPADIADVHDEESNCTIARHADHHARVDVVVLPKIAILDTSIDRADMIITGTNGNKPVRFRIEEPQIICAKLASKALSEESLRLLLQTGLRGQIDDAIQGRLEKSLSGEPWELTSEEATALIDALSRPMAISRQVRHLKAHAVFAGYHDAGRQATPSIDFTRRTGKFKAGRLAKGNTRLSFYKPSPTSRLHRAHAQYSTLLVPDFHSHTQKTVQFHQQRMDDDAVAENIHIEPQGLSRWIAQGGLARALELHQRYFEAKRGARRIGKQVSLRTFAGTYPAEFLMEQGVITIAPGYSEQLQFILRRTQFFDSLGLFCFQSLSHDAILKHPKAITMARHRQDKAAILRHVRQIRNSERREVKAVLQAQRAGSCQHMLNLVHDNLKLLEATAQKAVEDAATGLASSLLHLRFHTGEVSAQDMANVQRLWLSLYLSSPTPDTLLGAIMTTAQLKALKSYPGAYIKACSLVGTMADRLSRSMNNQIDAWQGVVADLNALLHETREDSKAPIEQYQAIIARSPYAIDGYETFAWNPNQDNFRRMLRSTLAQITASLDQLTQGREGLLSLARHGRRTGAQRLSLAGKLSLLDKRAA